jgi:hypothetical protein
MEAFIQWREPHAFLEVDLRLPRELRPLCKLRSVLALSRRREQYCLKAMHSNRGCA